MTVKRIWARLTRFDSNVDCFWYNKLFMKVHGFSLWESSRAYNAYRRVALVSSIFLWTLILWDGWNCLLARDFLAINESASTAGTQFLSALRFAAIVRF